MALFHDLQHLLAFLVEFEHLELYLFEAEVSQEMLELEAIGRAIGIVIALTVILLAMARCIADQEHPL